MKGQLFESHMEKGFDQLNPISPAPYLRMAHKDSAECSAIIPVVYAADFAMPNYLATFGINGLIGKQIWHINRRAL